MSLWVLSLANLLVLTRWRQPLAPTVSLNINPGRATAPQYITTMKKFYTVRIYDNTCNVSGHESQSFNSFVSFANDSLSSCNDADYTLNEEQATALLKKFEQYIADNNLEWASAKLDYFDFED